MVPRYFYRGPRVYLFVYRVALPRGDIKKKKIRDAVRESGVALRHRVALKKKRIARGPREWCRFVPLFYLRHFLRGSLTLIPRSLPLNRTETLHTGYRGL